MIDLNGASDEQREAIRLVLSIVHASTLGLDTPGEVLVDGFSRHGHVRVNGHEISTVAAINAAARLASSLLSEHAEDPEQALGSLLRLISEWEAANCE